MKSNSHLKSTAIAVILAYGAAIATPVFAQSAPANPGCKNAGAAALVPSWVAKTRRRVP